MAELYAFSAKALGGEDVSFDRYRGKVLLIVNTASQCGFTPQYQGLQALYERFSSRGLVVLGFPCNQFGKHGLLGIFVDNQGNPAIVRPPRSGINIELKPVSGGSLPRSP